MEDWNYSFDAVSRDTWIRQIESDLKGKPIESLFATLWDGEYLIPVAHQEDLKGECLRLPNHLFQYPPLLTECFVADQNEPSDVNRQILQSLAYGTQVIRLKTGNIDFDLMESCLAGVMTDIVDAEIDIPFTSISESIAPEQLRNLILAIRIPVHDTPLGQDQLETMTRLADLHEERVKFIYSFSSNGDWIQLATGVFQQMLEHLKYFNQQGKTAEHFLSKCIFQLEADPVYFKQILQTRTLHFLLQNLALHLSGKGLSPTHKYLETYIPQLAEEKSDHFLIRASMSGLAASLSGTHRLWIHPRGASNEPELYKRAARNIHHLLSLESGMYKAEDPLAGAYSLDIHTRNWVEKIWGQLSV